MSGAHLISVKEIEYKLRDRVRDLCIAILPNGRRDQNYWTVGGTDGRPGNSMKVHLSGARVGMWVDHVDPDAPDMSGDCLHLIRVVECGGDMRKAIDWAKGWLGLEGMTPQQLARERVDVQALAEKRQKEDEEASAAKMIGARRLFHHPDARPIAGTPAEAYLEGRGIRLAALTSPDGRHPPQWPGSLKYHAEVWNSEAGCKIPAMLAMAVTPDGKHVATHRTFLQRCPRRGWTKIDSPNAKMVLGRIGGAFIPLRKGASGKSMKHMPAAEPMLLTEGIEDGLTVAMARPELRIGAAYSLPNLGQIVLPEQAGPLILACDRDNPTNRRLDPGDAEDRKIIKKLEALERAIARQQARGVTVKLVMPPVGVKDFNEWLMNFDRSGTSIEGRAA